jgi:hypothetical protein
MKTSGITAALPAQDLGRAKAFYVEKVGLQALESDFLQARDGQVGITVGDGASQLFVYPAWARSSGEFTQAVIHVPDMRAAVEQMRSRGVAFEEYDTPETQTERASPGCRVAARRPGSKTPKATWSALFQPEENQQRHRTTEASRTPGAWVRPRAIDSQTLRTGGSARDESSARSGLRAAPSRRYGRVQCIRPELAQRLGWCAITRLFGEMRWETAQGSGPGGGVRVRRRPRRVR